MPIKYDPIAAPDRLGLLQELRLPLDAVGWVPSWLGRRPRRTTNPRIIVLLPGFGATHRSMFVMESRLRQAGHEVHDWGLGRNTGKVQQLLAGLRTRVAMLRAQAEQPVVLVGWSLGGYLARELARDHPEMIRKVVTLGSPVIGGPRYTATARRYSEQGFDLDDIERKVASRFAKPLRVPVTALYSKRDGIVAWQACIDRWSPNVRHIEVSETHLGLVVSPRVIAEVAREVERDD